MTESCIRGAWKKLCPEFAVDFGGFDLSEELLEECLELARRVCLDELEEEDIDSLLETIGEELSTEELDEWEKQRRHWREYTICDAIWHVCYAWKEVTESCIRGAWKKLFPEFAVDFGGFDLSEELLEKCLELARKAGLDELEEEEIDSLLETIGEELSTDELEKQRRQLEEEVEAQQQPLVPSTTKQLMVNILQHLYRYGTRQWTTWRRSTLMSNTQEY